MSIRWFGPGLVALCLTACMLDDANGKGGGETCSSNDECESRCCYPATQIAPFCTTSGECMGAASNPSSGSSSGSSTPTGPAYVEFLVDFSKYGVAPGQVVTSIEAEGRSFAPRYLTNGTGKCTERAVFQGAPRGVGDPSDLWVTYMIHVRHYGSLDAIMSDVEYTNEDYGGGFSLSSLKPGCNTLTVYKMASNRLALELYEP